MSPLQCLFCDQSNPPAAKFCNECGTPLHFKPCPQCDGINGRFAGSCYRCGAAFSAIAGEEEMLLSPLQDVSGPVASLAAAVERRGAANEARATEVSQNGDDSVPPAPSRQVGSWPLAAGVGLLAIALPILGIVALNNADRDRGSDTDGAATLAATPSTVLAEVTGPPAPPVVAAAASEPRVEPAVSTQRASAAPAKTAQKRSQAPSRAAGVRSGTPARVATTSKRDSRATKSAVRATAPAARASKPQPTRHAESVQIAVRVQETPRAEESDVAADRPFEVAWLMCAEGRMLAGACDLRLLAKGN